MQGVVLHCVTFPAHQSFLPVVGPHSWEIQESCCREDYFLPTCPESDLFKANKANTYSVQLKQIPPIILIVHSPLAYPMAAGHCQ